MALTIPTQSYAAVTAVSALLQGRTFTATTTPTEAQVEVWLKAAAQEINDILRAQGMTVPITDTASSDRLALLNAMFAAGMAEASILATTTDMFSSTVGARYLASYIEGRKLLDKRGVAVGAAAAAPVGAPGGQADLQTGGEDEDPAFTTDMKF